MEILCCPLPTFKMGPWETGHPGSHCCLPYPLPPAQRMDWAGCALCCLLPSRRALACLPLSPEQGQARQEAFALGFELPHCMLGSSSYFPLYPSPRCSPLRVW